MMFQSYALFPHLTVEGNIAFGLKQDSMPKAEIAERVREMLALGQARRLRRAQASPAFRRPASARRARSRARQKATVLLLDEPLSALDRKLREDTRFELMELQDKLGLTFVIVTHDQEEAMTLADRIGVMNAGRLAQVATPSGIYEHPNSRWVADFIGDVNLIEGRVASSSLGHVVIESEIAGRLVVTHPADAAIGAAVTVAVRPEKIQIDTTAPRANDENCFAGRVAEVGYLGGVSIYKIKLDNGLDMKATAVNRTRLAEPPIGPGDRVWLSFAPESGVVLSQ